MLLSFYVSVKGYVLVFLCFDNLEDGVFRTPEVLSEPETEQVDWVWWNVECIIDFLSCEDTLNKGRLSYTLLHLRWCRDGGPPPVSLKGVTRKD